MTLRPQRRWLPAFSIRTLMIVMTLLCAYAACWWPTKTRGLREVHQHVYSYKPAENEADREMQFRWLALNDVAVVAPLVVSHTPEFSQQREYYFWFFGYVAKLPIEATIPAEEPLSAVDMMQLQLELERAIERANSGMAPESIQGKILLETLIKEIRRRNREAGGSP